jgi:beta-barrel assembly-enhancing protease
MKKLAISILMVAILAAPASAQFGDILKRGKQAKQVSEATAVWTPEQEQAIGEASAAKLVHVLGLYQNPDMNHYVSRVGSALASHSSRGLEYKFGILETESVSAFGMPGGYVFVTRGALANMKNEAELAGVLAHEIAHVDNRHLEKEIRGKKLTGIAASEGFEQIGNRVPYGGYLQNLGAQVVTQALTQSYSRDKEDEADRKGTELSAATGYDASGLKNFLATLNELKNKDPQNSKRATGLWGSTHPPLEQRVAELTPIAAQFPGGATNEARFKQNARFGPTPEEIAAQKKAEEDAAAAKKAAEAKNGPTTQPSKATTKSRFSKTIPKKE